MKRFREFLGVAAVTSGLLIGTVICAGFAVGVWRSALVVCRL